MKHYVIEFYSKHLMLMSIRIETSKPLSTKVIRTKLNKLGYSNVCLVWISGLK